MGRNELRVYTTAVTPFDSVANVLSSLLESNTTQLWPSVALINVTMMEGHASNSSRAVRQEDTHTEAAGVRGSRNEMFIYSLLSLCANLNCVETYD